MTAARVALRLGLRPAQWRLVLPLVPAQVLAFLGLTLSPLYLNLLQTQAGLAATTAGLLLSGEFLATACGALATAILLGRWSARRVALWGGVLTLLGLLGSALVPVAVAFPFVGVRLLCGFGSGVLMAAASALVVASGDPERVYGYSFTFNFILSATLLAGLGGSPAVASMALYFSAVAVAAMVLFIGIALLPSRGAAASAANSGAGVAGGAGARPGLSFLLAVFLIAVIANVIWVQGVALGTASGLSLAASAYLLGLAYYLSIAGTLLAGVTSLRFAYLPLLVAVAILLVAGCLLVLPRVPNAFLLGICAYGVAYGVFTTYLYGLGAALGDGGRWAAMNPGVQMFSVVVAPVLATALPAYFGSAALALLFAGCTFFALLLLRAPLRYAGRHGELLKP